jgi:carboxypeptidase family protein/TonB-dependent receptor-like protein
MNQMRARTFATLMVALLFVGPVAAQEQRGSIQGQVKDASGAVLPGATVVVKGTALPAGTTTVSDGEGYYRFPGLPPGLYVVTTELQGFTPGRVEAIEVSLGQIKKVDFTLTLGGVTESVQVTAESPLIDVKQNAAFANISKEFIQRIPKGRDFTSVVTVAPGANYEGKLGGISVDGASGAENVYVIDGINTTSIRTGQSAKGLITDFVEEVQVKSSGYNAEFGGSMGGVINVITKSGANNFHGDFGVYYSDNKLNGSVRPTLRLNPTDTTIAEYVTYPDDTVRRWEPGGTIGGPVLMNKAWFFAGYMPSLERTERTAPFNANGTTDTKKRSDNTHNLTANVSAQISNALRGKFAVNFDNYKRVGLLHNLDGTSNPTALFNIDLKQPGATYSGQLDYVAGKFYLATRAGYFRYDAENTGVPTDIRYIHSRSSVNFPGVPADLQRQQGFLNIPTNSSITRDLYTRLGVNFDVSYFANFAGQHTFKGGVQLDRYGNDVLSGEQAPNISIVFGETYAANDGTFHKGTFGWYSWRQFQTTGKVKSSSVGLYLQDAWSVGDRLTINAGLRTERERVPAFRTDLGGARYPIDFSFGDKLAPRLGFAYDVAGDGRWKAYGSWGLFYDIMKLELSRGAFGGDKWIESYYTLDTPNWNTLGVNNNFPGSPIEQIDFRHTGSQPGDCPTPNNPDGNCIDPDLQPSRQREFTLGLDHELNSRTSVGIRYVRKQIDYTIDDVGTIVPGVGEVYYYANPGFGLAEHTIGPEFPAQPKAKRDYDGVEIRATRRMTRGLQLNTSYLWSRLYGNFSGLASSDENGRSSPNVNRFFDGIYMSFDEKGNPTYGRLGTDRPHQFKVQAAYQFPFGTGIGFNQYVAAGTPISRQVSNFGLPFFYRGRGSEGRTPTYSQSDLYLQHEIRLSGKQLQFGVNILNLFDQDTTTDIFNSELRQNVSIADEVFFQAGGFDTQAIIAAQNRIRDARFLKDSGFQGRRAIRLGAKFIF